MPKRCFQSLLVFSSPFALLAAKIICFFLDYLNHNGVYEKNNERATVASHGYNIFIILIHFYLHYLLFMKKG